MQKVQDEHKENSLRWSQFQLDEQNTKVSIKDIKESVQKQLKKAKQVNESLTKMLAEISTHVQNFKALDAVVQKPEVLVDYADLDYATKLDFVEGVEPPLEHVSLVLTHAKKMVETL